ncbi:MAG: hypothetical protein HYV77_01725 [Candidatus Wildermuthbacteria bacterium]|nr:hypothetical protein [Candidatus Wildermuthbacteria bacterium]
MRKYKYYFKKPRSAIAKDIVKTLAMAGILSIATTSPYAGSIFYKAFKNRKAYKRREVTDTFTRLRRKGLIHMERNGHDFRISLTQKGKELAGYMQIDDLCISKPKKWDGKWRIILFDIANLKVLHRNAFRAKLRELGFIPLQKSVWVHPFPCKPEIQILRDFFGLEEEVRLITAEKIGFDASIKEHFQLV